MDKAKRNKLMWRWSVVSAALIGAFWLIWYLATGEMPVVSSVKMRENWIVELPFGIPHWTDLLLGPMFSCTLILVYYFVDDGDDWVSGLGAGLFIGLGAGLFAGLGAGLLDGLFDGLFVGLFAGMGVGLFIGLVVGEGAWLAVGPGVGLGAGWGAVLGAGLGVGPVIGLGVGPVIGLDVGLSFGIAAELAWVLKKLFVRWSMRKIGE